MGPTLSEWGRFFMPVVRIPGNLWRFHQAVFWRPAVFFCTYPELYGNLPVPVKPVVARLRWGEKCRGKLWGNWTDCSMRCGEGYEVGLGGKHSLPRHRSTVYNLIIPVKSSNTV